MSENLNALYEQEFKTEIAAEEINLDQILKLGVKKESLVLDCYLSEMYGLEIFNGKIADDEGGNQKKVQKLSEVEFNKNDELKNILAELESSEFDEQINKILITIRESE